ncbi:calcium-binding protein [Phaeobacter sp. HF9A]|nr:calcium-binding protein [Phaeobacter sp. HF9A]
MSDGITIFSYGGDDLINLRARSETVDVNTGSGNDTVRLGDGFSQVRTGTGRDVIRGGDGSDNIDGQWGRDRIFGGGGDDVYLSGGAGRDTVFGGAGDDHINDERGINRLFGGNGNDDIRGRGWLSGGAGDDVLFATARKHSDTFDFRLRGDDGFGRDTISGNFTDDNRPLDRLVFDQGTDIAHRIDSDSGNMIITASQDGEDIGVVVVQGFFDFGDYAQNVLDNIEFL